MSKTGDLLERLRYPEARGRRIGLAEMQRLRGEANRAVGNRLIDPASLALGYWEGVLDERLGNLSDKYGREPRVDG